MVRACIATSYPRQESLARFTIVLLYSVKGGAEVDMYDALFDGIGTPRSLELEREALDAS